MSFNCCLNRTQEGGTNAAKPIDTGPIGTSNDCSDGMGLMRASH